MRRTDYFIAALLALVSVVVYVLTLAPDVLPSDSGEFQFATPLLTIVHPTGYPLYLLLAKACTFIPIGNIAYRVNLFSAACAALTIGLFYLVVLRLLQQTIQPPNHLTTHLAASIAALTLAFSRTFWSQATEAEVYALNSFFVILLIGLSVKVQRALTSKPSPILRQAQEREGQGRGLNHAWLWLAFVLGLSLSHHRSIILLLPALVIYIYPFTGLRRVWKLALLLLLAPLALYLYTPMRYDATPYTNIKLDDQHIITTLANSPSAFAAHALGTGFSGALYWDAQSVERLGMTPQRVIDDFSSGWLGGWVVGWLALGLAMLGAFEIVRRRQWRTVFCLGMALITYILFNALYHIGDIGDFYTPVYIIMALLMAYGISRIAYRVWQVADGSSRITLYVLPFALLLLLLISNFAPMQQHDMPRAHWQQLLAQDVSNGAILISNDRDEMTPLYYLQLVEGVRPDLFPLFPLISPHFPHIVPLTIYALETSRSVYFIKPMDGLSVKFRVQPQGELVRVLGMQDTRPDQLLGRYSAALNLIGWSQIANRKSQIAIALFWQAQGINRPDLKTYVHLLDQDGKKIAQDDHTPGDVFYPPSQWATGETLRDEHTITLPPNLPRGEYQLVAGAYLPNGRGVEGVERIDLGVITLGK